MSGPADKIIDLIYGRWRSQILYAGVELGVFDHLAGNRSKQADAVAAEIGADKKLLYRLMRALASLGLLVEDELARAKLHALSGYEVGKTITDRAGIPRVVCARWKP